MRGGSDVWQPEGGGSTAVCTRSSAETSRTACRRDAANYLPTDTASGAPLWEPHISDARILCHVTWQGAVRAPWGTRSGTETQPAGWQLITGWYQDQCCRCDLPDTCCDNCLPQSWLTPNKAARSPSVLLSDIFALNDHCPTCCSLDYPVPLHNVSFCTWDRTSRRVKRQYVAGVTSALVLCSTATKTTIHTRTVYGRLKVVWAKQGRDLSAVGRSIIWCDSPDVLRTAAIRRTTYGSTRGKQSLPVTVYPYC